MEISFYTNHSELNKLDKDLTTVTTLSGTLKEGCSVTDPVILVEMNTPPSSEINYAHIPDFGRYYFVRAIDYVVGKQWRITMHVDVLMSFADAIRNCEASLDRQEFDYNLMIPDDKIQTTAEKTTITNAIGNKSFDNMNMIMVLANNRQRDI